MKFIKKSNTNPEMGPIVLLLEMLQANLVFFLCFFVLFLGY